MTEPEDMSIQLDANDIRHTKKIVGTALYYTRAVDPTMLITLSALSSEQTKDTENTAIRLPVTQFLDYCATYPSTTIRFKASNMRLKCHANASYLSEPNTHSRSGAHFYIGNNEDAKDTNMCNSSLLLLNLSTIIKHVMVSLSKTETAVLFADCKEATSLRTTLLEMGHPQGPNPVATDNTTTAAIFNDTCKQIHLKAIDMRFY